jgi:FkbM family methyltransferase
MNFLKIKQTINPKTVIDVGANTGWFSSNLRQVCPNSDIIMLEANPYCEEQLSKIGNSYAIVALSNEANKKITFYINRDDLVCCGASFYKEDTKFYDNCIEIELETHTLDEGELFLEEGVDLLKIDVQGSEKDIIQGSLETLKRTKNVLLECSFSNYNLGSPQIEEVIEFMEELGFYVNDIIEEHWSRPGIDFPSRVVHQIDVLFSKVFDDEKNHLCLEQIQNYRKKFDEEMK